MLFQSSTLLSGLTENKNVYYHFYNTSILQPRLADFILVLKDGELVESGSHQELQKAGKYYSELIKVQIEPIDHLAQLDET